MCGGCKKPIDIPDVAQPTIINLAAVSFLIIEHPEQTLCPNCFVPVVVGLMQANLALMGMPVPPRQQKNVILAPNGTVPN
jgi:hypothetical protein